MLKKEDGLTIQLIKNSKVLSALCEHQKIDKQSPFYRLIDWLLIYCWKTFEPSKHLTELNVVNDKACSAFKNDLILNCFFES